MSSFDQMRAFVAVVEAGSFVRGAAALGISPAMMSKHIADLEAALAVRLLNRTTRKIALTEVGASYFEQCAEILARVEEANALASDFSVSPKGLLKVSAPVGFGVLHVAPALPEYHEAYPDVRIDISFNDRHVDLVEEGFDLAIRIGLLNDSSLVARRLTTVRVMLLGAPSYFEKHGQPKTPQDLRDHKVINYSLSTAGNKWRFRKDGKDHVVTVDPILMVSNGEAASVTAAGGMGLIYQPTFLACPYLQSGELVPVMTDYELPELAAYAVYPPSRHLPAKARTFIDFLAKRFGGNEPYWDAADAVSARA